MENFKQVERPTGMIWAHVSAPIWIVEYEAIEGHHPAYYQAYKVKDYCLPITDGRNPWSLDNRRLGDEGRGFPTLAAAARAAERAI